MKLKLLSLLLISGLVIPSTIFAADLDSDGDEFNEGPIPVLTDKGWVPASEAPAPYWVAENPVKTVGIIAVGLAAIYAAYDIFTTGGSNLNPSNWFSQAAPLDGYDSESDVSVHSFSTDDSGWDTDDFLDDYARKHGPGGGLLEYTPSGRLKLRE